MTERCSSLTCSIVPSVAAFTLSIETGFYERYLRFYADIQKHAPHQRIEANQRELIQIVFWMARAAFWYCRHRSPFWRYCWRHSFSPRSVSPFGNSAYSAWAWPAHSFRQVNLFLSIVLSYFDQRRIQVALSVLLLLTTERSPFSRFA